MDARELRWSTDVGGEVPVAFRVTFRVCDPDRDPVRCERMPGSGLWIRGIRAFASIAGGEEQELELGSTAMFNLRTWIARHLDEQEAA